VREFARALAADPRVELERLLPVTPPARRLLAPRLRDDAVKRASVGC